MKKKTLIVFISFILTLFLTAVLYNMHTSDLINAPTLIKAFANSGAKMVSSECYVWSELDEGYCRKNGIEQTAETIADRLGIVENISYSKNSEEDYNFSKVIINGMLSDGRQVVLGVQADRKLINGPRFTGTISIIEEGDGVFLKASGEKALSALKGIVEKISLNFSITGSFDSEIGKVTQEEISRRVFATVDARKVYEIEDRNLISISAYSPYIINHVEVEGERSNLNLAMRYNMYEGKTYIWLATPVITTEY